MKKVLIIDDDRVSLSTAKGVLGDDYKVIAVLDGAQGLKFLEKNECDLILLDINMPGMNGFEVLSEIQKLENRKDTPVIFLTSDNDADTETRCLESGAMDFISKPFVPSVIRSRVHRTLELEELRANLKNELDEKTQENEEIKAKSFTDALTGLWNREYTENKVNELLSQGHKGALLMTDLDNFKGINDTHGHQEGDRVLNLFAETLRKFSNENDVICRIGGDEFVAFFTDKTSRAEVGNIASDIITYLNQEMSKLNYQVKTSVSIGISVAGTDGQDFSKLYNCGDKALYYVKNNGKNSFRFFSDGAREEKNRGSQTIDLKHLGEILSRSDSGHGAYMLDFENFHNVYCFVKRSVERNNRTAVTVLFNLVPGEGCTELDQEETSAVMEVLDKAIFTSLRRDDISTRYSGTQTMAVLLDTDADAAQIAVNRIMKSFSELYTGSKIAVVCSIEELKSHNEQRKSE